MFKQALYVLVIVMFNSCSDIPSEIPEIDMKQMQEDLIQANKNAVSKESLQIDAYVKEKSINVIRTKTGLRYCIYHDLKGEKIEEKQQAVIRYKVSLLDGTECYSTDNKSEEFIVGKDYVESGLHEGIQNMSIGDKAIIIIPSHLGHGLAGDSKKIPFKSTIVYDIELIDIN